MSAAPLTTYNWGTGCIQEFYKLFNTFLWALFADHLCLKCSNVSIRQEGAESVLTSDHSQVSAKKGGKDFSSRDSQWNKAYQLGAIYFSYSL